MSEAILEFNGECNINDELEVIGCDLINVNTGSMRVVIYEIEEKIGHRVMWLICLLHINELPLRHLFTNLDEITCGKNIF